MSRALRTQVRDPNVICVIFCSGSIQALLFLFAPELIYVFLFIFNGGLYCCCYELAVFWVLGFLCRCFSRVLRADSRGLG
jgi:hypothetical protein